VLSQRKRVVIAYYTYFNEAVAGLEVGAAVKGRGVNVGRVGEITFAPDHRMVKVRMDLDERTLEDLGLQPRTKPPPPDLRAQLASQGLTGATFVSIDFFDPERNPPPALTFTPAERYIPAATSQLKGLEETILKAMDGLVSLVDSISREGLTEKAAQVLARADQTMASLDHLLRNVDRQKLPEQARTTLDELRAAVSKVGKALDGVGGDGGLVATAQRSVSSIGEVGRNAVGAASDLEETLSEIREAAAAIHLLASELEHQPDALLKGRASGAP
jgi:ABC-type transporter Mla subunit MlaD